MRIGFGKDFHKLIEGRKLVLGGEIIPFEKGEMATSDGDVVFHALSDALLGAIAAGDIGRYFPSSDPRCKNMDSSTIVKFCVNKVSECGYKISNIDLAIELEKPKILDFVNSMRKNIANLCNVEINQVNVKGMTNEKLDAVGRGEAVACYAVVLIEMI